MVKLKNLLKEATNFDVKKTLALIKKEKFLKYVVKKDFKGKVDSKTLDHLEDFLIESDVGVVVAKELKQIFLDTKIDPKKDSLNRSISIGIVFIERILFFTSPN